MTLLGITEHWRPVLYSGKTARKHMTDEGLFLRMGKVFQGSEEFSTGTVLSLVMNILPASL